MIFHLSLSFVRDCFLRALSQVSSFFPMLAKCKNGRDVEGHDDGDSSDDDDDDGYRPE